MIKWQFRLHERGSLFFCFFGFSNFFRLIVNLIVVVSSIVFDGTIFEWPLILSSYVLVCDIHIVERDNNPDWIEADETEPEVSNVIWRESEAAIAGKKENQIRYNKESD